MCAPWMPGGLGGDWNRNPLFAYLRYSFPILSSSTKRRTFHLFVSFVSKWNHLHLPGLHQPRGFKRDASGPASLWICSSEGLGGSTRGKPCKKFNLCRPLTAPAAPSLHHALHGRRTIAQPGAPEACSPRQRSPWMLVASEKWSLNSPSEPVWTRQGR